MIERKIGDVDLAVRFELHGHGILDESVVADHGIGAVDSRLNAFLITGTIVDERIGQPQTIRRQPQRAYIRVTRRIPTQKLVYPLLKTKNIEFQTKNSKISKNWFPTCSIQILVVRI